MTKNLFRPEVLSDRHQRLPGDVVIAVPIGWQVIGYLVLIAFIVAAVFLSLANFSRVEVVRGIIVPDTGVSTIVPTRAGVISSIDVRDGQDVTTGTLLGSIRAEEDGADVLTTGERVEAAIAQQDASLQAQMLASRASVEAEQNRLVAQRSGLVAEIEQLESQVALQSELIRTAEEDLNRIRAVYERGFISGRDLQNREELLLTRRQGLAQLTQSLAARRASLAEASRTEEQLRAQAQAQMATLSVSRAQVAQSAASAQGARAYVLRAPVTGRVTALVGRQGQVASPSTPIMSIIPSGSVLRADLRVPSAAIGFVEPGQDVRLAIDAFPYQRFGTVRGRVLTVSSSAVSQQDSSAGAVMVYPVSVQLDQTDLLAFGRREPLIPGMTLTARIVAEKQSLLEWLFEPLFAVRRR